MAERASHLLGTATIVGDLVVASIRTFSAGLRGNLLRMAGSAVLVVSEAIGIALLVHRFGGIHGWGTGDVLVLLGVADAGLGIGMAIGEPLEPPVFSQLLRDGRFDTALTRPLSPWLWVVANDVQIRNLGRIVAGLGIATAGAVSTGLSASPLTVVALLGGVLSTGAVMIGILTMGAALTMWTIEGTEALNVFTYGGATVAGYPLDIYSSALRAVFVWLVPVGVAVYAPVQRVADLPGVLPAHTLWLLPGLIAAFALAAAASWRAGLRHYTGSGA